MRVLLEELAATYVRHIRLEDQRVFVLASQVLSQEQLQEIGREMRRRRAVDPGREQSRCAERRRRTLAAHAHDPFENVI
jgi:hemerythrin-like domain-containing protein